MKTQRQYNTDLQSARSKTRRLKDENKPSSDSDTSMDDLSDDDDDEEEDNMNTSRSTDIRAGGRRQTDATALSSRSRKDKSLTGYNGNTNHTDTGRNGAGGESQGAQASQGSNHRNGNYAQQYNPRQPPQISGGSATAISTANASNTSNNNNNNNSNGNGRIVWQGRGYHNHRYIFPVGFRSKKQYTSLSDTSKKTYFISEILDGGEQPIFQITLEDMPEKVFRHSSSSGAWELALKGLMELGFNAKTHASGPDMYGLTNLGVIKYIQEMPNAHRCRRYMPLKWIVEDDDDNADSSSHTGSVGVGAGSKSPGRKKKINNSLYASNHEVLVSTMQEEENRRAKSNSRDHFSMSSKPYQPRKYTKRKTNNLAPPPVPLTDPSLIPPVPPVPQVHLQHHQSHQQQQQQRPQQHRQRDDIEEYDERRHLEEDDNDERDDQYYHHSGGEHWMDVKQESSSSSSRLDASRGHSHDHDHTSDRQDQIYMEPQRVPLLSPSHKNLQLHHQSHLQHHPHLSHHHHHHHHHDPHNTQRPHDSSVHEP
ncbi:hypothetical protein BGZ83_007361 [Gryganskiella cystojenkinii]|nr:hypothetical protein BGZ83_007361 [Gryganskiella cystojenkinii]